jgi:hypothetical protein
MKIRNEKYRYSFSNFFKKLFRYFSAVTPTELPYDRNVSLYFDEESNPYPTIEKTIKFDKLISNHLTEITSWPEYKELRNNVILIGPYGDKWEDSDKFQLHNNYIPHLFHELYEKSKKSFKLDHSILEEKYILLENSIYEKEWIINYKSPLFNIEIETEKFDVANNLTIYKIPQEDLTTLFEISHRSPGITPSFYSPYIKTIISSDLAKKKEEPDSTPEVIRKSFVGLAATLTLFKRSPVLHGPIYSVRKNVWTVAQGISFSGLGPVLNFPVKSVTLLEKEYDEVIQFYNRYKNVLESSDWLKVASERLIQYGNRYNIYDKFIDIMVIFEILFLPHDSQELKYKLSTRCAAFLENKANESRDVIFRKLGLAYDIRSNIVHNGKISNNSEKKLKRLGINISDLISSIEIYLFESFEKLINNPDSRKDLDNFVLNIKPCLNK